MHERAIAGINPKPPPDVEFTSFVYRIFGGKIRSQVKCTECDYESNTYDPFLDLSLEINHASSVEKALRRFTAGESLDGANKYKCPKQKRAVRAVKRMTIETAPSVLVVQLKRFEFSMSGRKISKQVEFDPVLDLSPYMSHRPKTPEVYDLYGVLVHQGHSMHSGHYFCFVKGGANGDWHKFDDTRVALTAERNVLGQHAYILFYIKRQRPTPVVAGPKIAKAGPQQAKQQQEKAAEVKHAKQAVVVKQQQARVLQPQAGNEQQERKPAAKRPRQPEEAAAPSAAPAKRQKVVSEPKKRTARVQQENEGEAGPSAAPAMAAQRKGRVGKQAQQGDPEDGLPLRHAR